MSNSDMENLRFEMVETQLVQRGIRDQRLLDVMKRLPREIFLPADLTHQAYQDRALPVELGQTISQPYIVACMTQALELEPHHRVLEIGTGTGYQTAILAYLAEKIYSVERHEKLSHSARDRVKSLGLENICCKTGDGTCGWPDHAPFDRIIVTAAAPRIIQPLVEQLENGGLLVMPVGEEGVQRLTTIERRQQTTIERPSIAVRFVKLIGEHGFKS